MEIPKAIETILDRLEGAGHKAYVVGGAVRDICLDRPPIDWDVATSASVSGIETIFHDDVHYNLKHETVTIVKDDQRYEITTFKNPELARDFLKADLGHRDFTLNAMAYDRNKKEIIDPYRGRSDISGRLVRAVGDPAARFQEDPVRLMRGIRLATELNFQVEKETLQTISLMAERLGTVARERIRDELIKILCSRKPSVGFNLMLRTGLQEKVLPELLEGYRKRQNAHHRHTIYKHTMETVNNVRPDPILRLAALLHDIAKPRVRTKEGGKIRFLGHEKAGALLAAEIMEDFHFSNKMIGQVTILVAHHMIGYDSGWSDGAVRRLMRKVGLENMARLLSLREADVLAHGRRGEAIRELSQLKRRVRGLHERSLAVKTEDLAIDGNGVMKTLGLSRGPEVGAVLNGLLEKVTDHPELNTEEKLVALLEKMKRK